jgi:fructoselysine-6-P-deglycase FrlB-like protein/predicted NBD/HSP70 family sugar kinase
MNAALMRASHTWTEIARQPRIWSSVAPALAPQAGAIREWIAARGVEEIWFCGAGSSAFIGDSLSAYLAGQRTDIRYLSMPTTELVAHPGRLLRAGARRLLVSFGRSGNSPETLATLNLLEHADVDGLHITCNPQGALASGAGPRQRALVLPVETHDAAFAMTSSYSTMLLYALACLDSLPLPQLPAMLGALAQAGERLLEQGHALAAQIPPPQRVVFLGGGELLGAARECALKVLELTAGKVASFWESPLGLRHGPKSLIDANTRIVVLLSTDDYARQYDLDALEELRRQYSPEQVLTIGPASARPDLSIAAVAAGWAVPLYVVPGQLLALYWSSRLGLEVDNPFPEGRLSRVVKGVTIYPPPRSKADLYGGIDVGGTKIEACLFDERFRPLERRRVDTARGTYEDLLNGIVAEVGWLDRCAGRAVDIGVGLPGLVDHQSGRSLTSNLPASGRPLRADLIARLNRKVAMANDCKCFALSEANGGAAADAHTVLGLILGTGVGAGVVQRGRLVLGHNDLPGEIGHLGIPAAFITRHRLPQLACGCGRSGCYETLVSGPGLTRLAERLGLAGQTPAQIAAAARAGQQPAAAVLELWVALLAELIFTAQCTIDMDCVVLGGGLSLIADLDRLLAAEFRARALGGREVRFAIARFGDASGARGAAMLQACS